MLIWVFERRKTQIINKLNFNFFKLNFNFFKLNFNFSKLNFIFFKLNLNYFNLKLSFFKLKLIFFKLSLIFFNLREKKVYTWCWLEMQNFPKSNLPHHTTPPKWTDVPRIYRHMHYKCITVRGKVPQFTGRYYKFTSCRYGGTEILHLQCWWI